jgi:hypothetical protein
MGDGVLSLLHEAAIDYVANDPGYGWITVRNDYAWNGYNNPRAGTITVRVDGKRKGAAATGETERIPVYPGVHTVRLKLSLGALGYLPPIMALLLGFLGYLSPSLMVSVSVGSTVCLRADMPRDGSLFSRCLRALFHPLHWLVLEEITNDSESAPAANL